MRPPCLGCSQTDILVVLRLDLGQISFSLVENAFATRQLAALATRIAFKTFWLKCRNQNFEIAFGQESDLRL